MSEAERMDVDRRAFLRHFAAGAAALPILVTSGVFRIPDIAGWGSADGNHYALGYGNGYGWAYGYAHGRGPVFG